MKTAKYSLESALSLSLFGSEDLQLLNCPLSLLTRVQNLYKSNFINVCNDFVHLLCNARVQYLQNIWYKVNYVYIMKTFLYITFIRYFPSYLYGVCSFQDLLRNRCPNDQLAYPTLSTTENYSFWLQHELIDMLQNLFLFSSGIQFSITDFHNFSHFVLDTHSCSKQPSLGWRDSLTFVLC